MRLIESSRAESSRTRLNRITVRFRCSGRSPIHLIWVVFRANLFAFRLCGRATRVLLCCPSPAPSSLFTYLLSRCPSVALLTKRVIQQRTATRAAALQSNNNKNKVKRTRSRRLRAYVSAHDHFTFYGSRFIFCL